VWCGWGGEGKKKSYFKGDISPAYGTYIKAQDMDTQELDALYRSAFPKVAAMVRRYGGDLDTAKDLLHDALLIFLEKETPDVRVSPEAYIMGIARNLWRREARRAPNAALPEEMPAEEERREQPQSIWPYLRSAGKKCMQLLTAYYEGGQTMEEIADTFEYSSAHSATVQKYKCLERVREQLKTSEVHASVFK
jgi:RNA polymerase sigma factor (sigma-70 family)